MYVHINLATTHKETFIGRWLNLTEESGTKECLFCRKICRQPRKGEVGCELAEADGRQWAHGGGRFPFLSRAEPKVARVPTWGTTPSPSIHGCACAAAARGLPLSYIASPPFPFSLTVPCAVSDRDLRRSATGGHGACAPAWGASAIPPQRSLTPGALGLPASSNLPPCSNPLYVLLLII
jgi:hypothetical protein